MLITYYRLKFNPDIKMEGRFLETLGFKPCGHCFKEDEGFWASSPPTQESGFWSSTPSKHNCMENGDLPF
ncbi:hypothetical protein [Pedobacter psychroterrae]|uniref:Uncharacterized protein n=1 Tax=Pedobacter psychroterrae TaxID=2530453 RepID=A0A4R0NLR3_9SPHI|nr:hypothetical protein [Pedobacter psychroterrae]TCC99974.1 hypothetical protein EZ437_17190 [Pedobacter psychroterrae]